MIDAAEFRRLVEALGDQGAQDIKWSENIGLPASADDFAGEAIFVIANSGMHHAAGRNIHTRVMAALGEGKSASDVFGHVGKAAAMDAIWSDREELYLDYLIRSTPEQQLDFCAGLPWVGPITKYHLAKNFGADVAKPDRHLQRLADAQGVTPQELCDQLAAETGYRAATIDVILWRACATGLIDTLKLAKVTNPK